MQEPHVIKDYKTEKGVPLLLHENKFFRMYFNGYFHYLEGVKYGRGVCTVPYFENGDLLLVRLLRTPNIGYSFEFPRGGVDTDESYEEATKRELEEETGYSSNKENIHYLGQIAPDTATINGQSPVYAVKLTDDIPDKMFDKTEIESVLRVPEETFKKMCVDGTITCAQTLASYALYKIFTIQP